MWRTFAPVCYRQGRKSPQVCNVVKRGDWRPARPPPRGRLRPARAVRPPTCPAASAPARPAARPPARPPGRSPAVPPAHPRACPPAFPSDHPFARLPARPPARPSLADGCPLAHSPACPPARMLARSPACPSARPRARPTNCSPACLPGHEFACPLTTGSPARSPTCSPAHSVTLVVLRAGAAGLATCRHVTSGGAEPAPCPQRFLALWALPVARNPHGGCWAIGRAARSRLRSFNRVRCSGTKLLAY